MRKKKKIKKHLIKPDEKFSSVIVSRLINYVMRKGEKRTAKNIVYQAASEVEKIVSMPFLTVLEGAIVNVKPSLETKSRKRGASTQREPVKVQEKRALILALRWIVNGAKEKKSSRAMFEKLAEEIREAYNKTGEAFKKKENIHKEAMGNMAFAKIK
jgi:small subunit ribosomal protein S7